MKKKYILIVPLVLLLIYAFFTLYTSKDSRRLLKRGTNTSHTYESYQSVSSETISSSSETTASSINEAAEEEARVAKLNQERQWAQSVFDEALQKLINEGAIQMQTGYLFSYIQTDSYEYAPFLTQAALQKYTENEATIGKKPIICHWDPEESIVKVDLNGNPEGSSRYCPYIDHNVMFKSIMYDRFAASIEECDTLVLYGGFESNREKEYYKGGVDRVTTTTLVFIMDPKAKTTQHIEIIGFRTPSFSQTTDPVGSTAISDLIEYIEKLLAE